MNLYKFGRNYSWGPVYAVLAKTKEDAILFLSDYLMKESQNDENYVKDYINFFTNIHGGDDGNITEHGEGVVIEDYLG